MTSKFIEKFNDGVVTYVSGKPEEFWERPENNFVLTSRTAKLLLFMVAYALFRMLLRKGDPLWTIMYSNRSIRAAVIFSYSSTERMRRKMHRKPRGHFKPVSKENEVDLYINFDGVFG